MPSLQTIEKRLTEKGIPLMAVADAEAINRLAPAGHRPQDHLPGAKRMLVFARPLPLLKSCALPPAPSASTPAR